MSLRDVIACGFWESRGLDFPKVQFRSYPTMLTLEEMRMLFALASSPQLPAGDICDLGAFMGGSSISLAAGVQASSADRVVHSYDRFEFNDQQFDLYLKGHPQRAAVRAAGYGVEVFHQLTADYASTLEVHCGDFLNQVPPDEIALCFVDLDKSFELNRKIVNSYFARLVPGAIVVQQDFFMSRTPWTVVTMHRLSDVLPFVGATKANSAIFALEGELSAGLLQSAVADGASLAEVEAAYKFFISKCSRFCHQEVLEAGLHRYQGAPNVRSTHDYPEFKAGKFFGENLKSKL